jgi:hypothetical protein
MAVTRARPELRKRGKIEERNWSLRVKVYAGLDPVTGKRIYLRQKIDGTDRPPTGKPRRRSTTCSRR